jgi:hypothetical protein
MLEDLSLPVKLYSCRVRTLREEMSESDGQILEDAVMNPAWPCKTLQNELLKREIKLSDTVIKNHREKRCSCWKI